MMAVIEMVLCGTVNRRIVRALNASGLKPIGFSGADASTLLCKKADERLGQVGQIERVGTNLIDFALQMEDELGSRGIPCDRSDRLRPRWPSLQYQRRLGRLAHRFALQCHKDAFFD